MRASPVVILLLATLLLTACGRKVFTVPTPVARALAPGEVIGRVERASSATPDAGERTLMSVTCQDGRLKIRTNIDQIVAASSCAPPIAQASLDQLLGMPAVITYTGDHLVIENTSSSTKLELPGTNATVGAIDGAP